MKLIKCVNCQAKVKYRVIDCEYEYEEEGVKIKYAGKRAICSRCGNEIIIDEIEDYNQLKFEKAYRQAIIAKKRQRSE